MILFLLLWVLCGVVTFCHLTINPRKGIHPAIVRELMTPHTLLMMCVTGVGSILFVFVPAEWINDAYADFIKEFGDDQ